MSRAEGDRRRWQCLALLPAASGLRKAVGSGVDVEDDGCAGQRLGERSRRVRRGAGPCDGRPRRGWRAGHRRFAIRRRERCANISVGRAVQRGSRCRGLALLHKEARAWHAQNASGRRGVLRPESDVSGWLLAARVSRTVAWRWEDAC
eukprot:870436-Prymnesium_polylepis.1